MILSSITKVYLDEIKVLKSQIRSINQDIVSLESTAAKLKNRKQSLQEKIINLNQNLQTLKETNNLIKNNEQ